MANMFSGNQEKKIPKSFKDCYKTDGITKNLWLWCERLEKWGLAICVIMAVVGVAEIIFTGVQVAEILYGHDSSTVTEYSSVFDAVITTALNWLFYCFIEYCSYHILALLVGSLATIVQHTKITANITLYTTAKKEGFMEDNCDEEEKTIDKVRKKPSKKYSSVKYGTNGEYVCPKCKMSNDSQKICERCGFNPFENNL